MSEDFSLDVIGVAKPCPADWDGMTPPDDSGSDGERVRHCELCKLNVYNLSGMTRQEVTDLVREREGRLCVRFYRRADGTVLTSDCPVGLRRAARWARRRAVGAMVIVFVMLAAPMAFAARWGGPDASAGNTNFTQRITNLPGIRHVIAWLNPAPAPVLLMGDYCALPAPGTPPTPAPPVATPQSGE